MSFETSCSGFSTNLLVADIHHDMGRKLYAMPDNEAVRTAFAIPNPDAPSLSYGIEALAQGGDYKFATEVWLPNKHGLYRPVTNINQLRRIRDQKLYSNGDETSTLDLVQELNNRKGIDLDGVAWLSSAGNRDLFAKISEQVDPELDLDGIAANPLYTPATPEGMADIAEYILRLRGTSLGKFPVQNIVVLGNGGVASPLVETVLPSRGVHVPPENHYKDRADLQAGAERLAKNGPWLGFTATRAAGNIKELPPNSSLIDVGYAELEDGTACGNASPELRAMHGHEGRFVLRFYDGGGPVTIAKVYMRAVDRALDRTRCLQLVG